MVRKQRRGEDTAARLLDAALEVYADAGAETFTVHAVVAKSGISLGSLYHHFGSFDGLSASLYARSIGELLDSLVVAVERTKSARVGITGIVRRYLAFTMERPAESLFVHASSYASFVPTHAAIIEAAKAPRIARLLAWLHPHVRAREVVNLPDALFEMILIGPVAEVSRRWLAGAPGIDLDETARILPDRIWQALRRDHDAT